MADTKNKKLKETFKKAIAGVIEKRKALDSKIKDA